MTAIQKLDLTLSTIVNNGVVYSGSLKELIEKGEYENVHEVYEVMERLEEDGYIKKEVSLDGEVFYRTKLNGRLFKESGGYNNQREQVMMEQEKTKSLLESQAQQKKALDRSQFWMVIAALVAALWYAKEILLWLWHHFGHYF